VQDAIAPADSFPRKTLCCAENTARYCFTGLLHKIFFIVGPYKRFFSAYR